nr:response regulator [Flaviramulus multivorans]
MSDSIQDNYGSAIANYNLGNIYNLMEDYKSAEEHYLLTLKVLKGLDDDYLTASSYFKLADIYRDKVNYNKAIDYYEKALKFSSRKYDTDSSEKKQLEQVFFDSRTSLCELYIENNDLEKALLSLLKINDAFKAQKVNSNSEGYFKYIYGIYYARQELHNHANSKFREATILLENKSEAIDLDLLTKVYLQLSISLAKSGKSTEAYLTLLDHNSYKDKLLNEEKTRQDLITKAKFLIEDYKNDAEMANAERLQQLAISNRIKKINVAIFITLLLLVISMLVIYRSYIAKRKLSKSLEIKNNELETAKNAALKTSELKSKFISNVSHELRTPLYGVVGITSLLLDNSNLNKTDRKHLKSLKYSGDYLLNLINDILQVSKMEANKIELKSISVNLKELLNDITNSFSYRLQETNNQMIISIDNYVPEYVKCDKVRLSQILINLIGNSIKFTTNGAINLNVRLLSLDENNVGLRFEVIDNGIGIPKEKFDTIFDNFSQLEDSNLNYQGTGLGLSITKNLIELFKSEIKLESQVGKGTQISFEVDFELDQNKTKIVSNFKALENKVEDSKETYRILVAEDNKINQVVTKNLLKKQGYLCTIVENGKEVLNEIKNNHYDLILMDINMPIMNGNEATEAIRRFNKSLPIIALTAADIDEVKQNCINVGYNDIILKPFDNYEFFQVINQNIENAKKEHNIRFIKAS